MNSKRALLMVGAIAVLPAWSGCAVPPAASRYQTHVETVSTVLITPDGSKLVFLGERHYIFDASRGLVTAINAPYHAGLVAVIGRVDVEQNGSASVPYRLTLAEGDPAHWAQATADGFKSSTDDKGRPVLVMAGVLKGTCYASNGVKPPAQSVSLNRSYRVEVRRETRDYAYKDLPSPIRAVGETGVAILSIPLVILTLPLLIVGAAFVLGNMAR